MRFTLWRYPLFRSIIERVHYTLQFPNSPRLAKLRLPMYLNSKLEKTAKLREAIGEPTLKSIKSSKQLPSKDAERNREQKVWGLVQIHYFCLSLTSVGIRGCTTVMFYRSTCLVRGAGKLLIFSLAFWINQIGFWCSSWLFRYRKDSGWSWWEVFFVLLAEAFWEILFWIWNFLRSKNSDKLNFFQFFCFT